MEKKNKSANNKLMGGGGGEGRAAKLRSVQAHGKWTA